MKTVTIEEAAGNLNSMIDKLAEVEGFTITHNDKPVARLLPALPPRKPGTLRGTVLYMAPDFDEPLEDFDE
jgi:antitoxin (DNA-binding transcriptional repressor) of toxin-antitoxin stability system